MNRATLIGAFLATLLAAPRAAADGVDDYVRGRLEGRRIPGLSVAVVRAGRVIKAAGYGAANLELEQKSTKETVYEIGSITKQFTAAAVMLLRREGKLKLDDPVVSHLPQLPEAWSRVTVRHLLAHTSGIRSYTSVGSFFELARTEHTPAGILKLVADAPLEFPPGDRYAYCNTGYYLLGMLVEKLSGQGYWEFLRERFFQPLKMDATRDSDPRAVIPRRASGYAWEGGRFRRRDAITASAGYAAGSLVSTVLDMAKWEAALDGAAVLDRESLEEMWTAATLNGGGSAGYGLGWAVREIRGHRNVSHGGGTPAFRSHMTRYPRERLAVIVLTNAAHADPSAIADGIAALYIPTLAERPVAEPEPETASRLRGLVAELREGRLDRALVGESLAALTTPARLAALKELLAPAGELRAFRLIERSAGEGRRRLRYRAEFRRDTWAVHAELDAGGRVTALRLTPD